MPFDPEKAFSVFKLDGAATHDLRADLLNDIVQANGQPGTLGGDFPDIRKFCQALGTWCVNNENIFGDACETAQAQAPNRIFPWAKMIIAQEIDNGRQIILASTFYPHALVKAYAVALEKELFDGQHVISSRGSRIGQRQTWPYSLKNLFRRASKRPEIIADNRVVNARKSIMPVVVNPLDRDLDELSKSSRLRMLETRHDGPHIVRFGTFHNQADYDVVEKPEDFLEAFYTREPLY